jgi:hypothetical protein
VAVIPGVDADVRFAVRTGPFSLPAVFTCRVFPFSLCGQTKIPAGFLSSLVPPEMDGSWQKNAIKKPPAAIDVEILYYILQVVNWKAYGERLVLQLPQSLGSPLIFSIA